MRRYYIGADPGVTGAVGIIDTETFEPKVFDTPHYREPTGKKTKKGNDKTRAVYEEEKILDILKPYSGGFAMIEQQVGMRGDVPARLVPLIYSYGLWVMACVACGIEFDLVMPRTWKKDLLGNADADKKEHVILAQELFPELDDKVLLVSKHGRADGLLLAWYGYKLDTRRVS